MGDSDNQFCGVLLISMTKVGMPEASLAEDDEPVESPDPVQAGPTGAYRFGILWWERVMSW